MEQEAAMGMLENLGRLRKLLVDYDREMQRLKIENDWLKMVLSDCEKKRIEGKRVVDMTRPQPCVRFKLNPISYWIAKLMEETAEAVHVAAEWAEMDDGETMEFGEVIASPKELAEELTDVITVCTSWLDALGYDEEARGKLQERVNEKNKARGYWG